MEESVLLATPGKGRKKFRDVSKWKKTQQQSARHRPKRLPTHPNCIHKKPNFSCSTLSMQDIRKFHDAFYANRNKIDQDKFILKHTSQRQPKRRRPTKGTRPNSVTVSYFIKTKEGQREICSKAFLSVLNISRFRVQNVCKHYLNHGTQPKENRGGDKRSRHFLTRKERVRNFILNLKCVDSHYGREKSQRQYMPSDCSIRHLWKAYCNQNQNLLVKYEYFRKIFVTDFNISFKSPATDACSECIRLKGLISISTGQVKAELICKLRVHKLKAKAFVEMLQFSEENVIKLIFDCQKNMVLPRVPDQAAYYSRQLYLYNFTVCEGHSKAKQTKDTITCYTWTENLRSKGSNEISSMLHAKITSLSLTNVSVLKLYCDGCPGQNKNITIIGMLMNWLYSTRSAVEEIHVIYPIVGHSYLPPDRIFGRIEKVVKRKEVIIEPKEYRALFSEIATVLDLESDFDVFDWKKAVEAHVKPPSQWHFQFSSAKRMIIKKENSSSGKKVLIRGEVSYRADMGVYKSVLKKGKSLATIIPEVLPKKFPINPLKLNDVDNLLKKHFGPDWRRMCGVNLTFYQRIIDCNDVNQLEEPDEDTTPPNMEEDGLQI